MAAVRPKGPWFHRFLIYFFTTVLVVLIYWTLGFLIDDAGQWSPPHHTAITQSLLPRDVEAKLKALSEEATQISQQTARVRHQQSLLREGTDNYQRTMQQMTELERLRLQKGESASEEQQQAVAQAEQQFLKNQAEYQAKTQELARLADEDDRVSRELAPLQQRLNDANEAGEKLYWEKFQQFQWRVAVVQLAMLLPLILVAGWLFRTYRQSIYSPLVYALGIAVGAKVLVVARQYFPEIYFKYLLIGTSLVVTAGLLFKLLQMIARPNKNWLLKQYREAYEAFLCPVCDFPIRRGPLKFLSWTRRTIKRLPLPTNASGNEKEDAYTCPLCATHLYEECPDCHQIRPSLLPACTHCGAVKSVEEIRSEGRAMGPATS
jgi:hypothetical protein